MCRASRTIRGARELGDTLRSSRGIRNHTLSVDVSRQKGGSFDKVRTRQSWVYLSIYNDPRRRIGDFVVELKILPDRPPGKMVRCDDEAL